MAGGTASIALRPQRTTRCQRIRIRRGGAAFDRFAMTGMMLATPTSTTFSRSKFESRGLESDSGPRRSSGPRFFQRAGIPQRATQSSRLLKGTTAQPRPPPAAVEHIHVLIFHGARNLQVMCSSPQRDTRMASPSRGGIGKINRLNQPKDSPKSRNSVFLSVQSRGYSSYPQNRGTTTLRASASS
jgi:hypothetical protein